MSKREYLGDSVYVSVECGMLRLTTENEGPENPSNEIYLDDQVLQSLLGYVKRLKETADVANAG